MTVDQVDDFVAITADGGLKKKILKEGVGASPTKGSTVHVHYVGTLYPGGEKFDSSRDRDQQFDFKIGTGQVIKGWDLGVATMKIGEVAELLCASDYAYGDGGSPPKIPGGATLKFEVELFDFEESADSPQKKCALALKHKESGTALFKSGDYAGALSAYLKGLDLVKSIDGASDEETTTVQSLKLSLLLNTSLCELKVGQARSANEHCDEILEMDTDNVKALFRKGQALCQLGEYSSAVEVLQNCQKVVPDDAAISRELLVVQQAKLNHLQKEKKMFSKLFG